MKIIVKKNKKPIRVYHHPRDVSYNRKHNTILLGSTDQTLFHLLEKPIFQWKNLDEEGNTELFVEFEIKDVDYELDQRDAAESGI